MKLLLELLACAGLGFVAAVAAFLFYRRQFVFDPDKAPPAFGPELPHEFAPCLGDSLTPPARCCKLCGGGEEHSVHHGVRWIPQPETINPDFLK